jgi:hypothetical protein
MVRHQTTVRDVEFLASLGTSDTFDFLSGDEKWEKE